MEGLGILVLRSDTASESLAHAGPVSAVVTYRPHTRTCLFSLSEAAPVILELEEVLVTPCAL